MMKSLRSYAMKPIVATCIAFAVCSGAHAAPDEEELGKSQGYPNMGNRSSIYAQKNAVGSITSMDSLYKTNIVPKGSKPVREFGTPAFTAPIKYQFKGEEKTLDNWIENNRALATLVIKDNTMLVERYQYDRTSDMKFVGFSMSKTVVGFLVGAALKDGSIKSIDDTVGMYEKDLADSDYGKVTIRNLLRMNSGMKWYEMGRGDLDPSSDVKDLADSTYRQYRSNGGVSFVKRLRANPDTLQGTVYNYSSADTFVLGTVLRAATNKTLAAYPSEKIWQNIGAEADASWNADYSGVEASFAYFNARPRDWARMALWMADGAVKEGVITADYWNEMTATDAQPARQKARSIFKYYGYGYQTWIMPYQTRTFALVGSWGQMIVVQPATKTVFIKLMARKTQKEDITTFQEDTYLVHGILKEVAKNAAQIPMPN